MLKAPRSCRYQHPTCKQTVPPCPVLDPEGLFATAGAACSVFIGLLYGFLMLQVSSCARLCALRPLQSDSDPGPDAITWPLAPWPVAAGCSIHLPRHVQFKV